MSLRTRLLLAIGYVVLVAVVAFVVPVAINLSERTNSEVRVEAESQGDLLAVSAAEELGEGPRHLQFLVDVAADRVRGRVVIVDSRGRLSVDSERAPAGSDFSNRPEIAAALDGQEVQEVRESHTLGMDILATAVPIFRGDRVAGAARITQSIEAVNRAVERSLTGLIAVGGLVLLIGLAAGALVARQLSRPVRRLTGSAERIAAGELEELAPVEGSSEQQALARSFNEMTARLRQTLENQREFVADASHQLRTPLTGLRLRIEEARVASDDPTARRELDAATRDLDRLSRTVEELLLLSRIGERSVPAERVDLRELTSEAVERWRHESELLGIRLTHERGNGASVWCPPADAARVLDLLVENGLRYSTDGGEVSVVAGPGLRVEVLDRGPGLDSEDAERVFERFRRGSAGRRGPAGTGLGLPIARGLARAWGGEVTLGNRQGGGARAVVSFPPPPGERSGPPRIDPR